MSLCPVCGRYLCDCEPEERGQTCEEMMRPLTKEEETAWAEHSDAYGYIPEKVAAAKMFAHIPPDWEKQWEDLVELIRSGRKLEELFEGLSEVEHQFLSTLAPGVPAKVLSDCLPTQTILNILGKRRKVESTVS